MPFVHPAELFRSDSVPLRHEARATSAPRRGSIEACALPSSSARPDARCACHTSRVSARSRTWQPSSLPSRSQAALRFTAIRTPMQSPLLSRCGQKPGRIARCSSTSSAPVADGQQIVVPVRGRSAPSGGAAAVHGMPAGGPVHLNTATLEELDSLPGIGPVTAQKILDYRTEHGAFASVDELDSVPGIGPTRLAELKKVVQL